MNKKEVSLDDMSLIKKFYDNLPQSQKGKFKLKVCNICDISFSSVGRKLATNTWTKLEVQAICNYIRSYE